MCLKCTLWDYYEGAPCKMKEDLLTRNRNSPGLLL
jgi:hypothetical protein